MLYSQPRWYFEPYHCQDYILATYLYWYYANPPPPPPPSLPSGRRCIECFWCPFVFYHHHPLPHERVPTFRFSINWLDYSSHSNQLARHTRLFALVIEIIIGPGEDIYICVYIYQWFGISELLCRYHVPLLPRDKFGIIAGSIYFHSCNLDCDLRIFNAFLMQFLFPCVREFCVTAINRGWNEVWKWNFVKFWFEGKKLIRSILIFLIIWGIIFFLLIRKSR